MYDKINFFQCFISEPIATANLFHCFLESLKSNRYTLFRQMICLNRIIDFCNAVSLKRIEFRSSVKGTQPEICLCPLSVYYPTLLIFTNFSRSSILMFLPFNSIIPSLSNSDNIRTAPSVDIADNSARSFRVRY